jgi:hypothetical protein
VNRLNGGNPGADDTCLDLYEPAAVDGWRVACICPGPFLGTRNRTAPTELATERPFWWPFVLVPVAAVCCCKIRFSCCDARFCSFAIAMLITKFDIAASF